MKIDSTTLSIIIVLELINVSCVFTRIPFLKHLQRPAAGDESQGTVVERTFRSFERGSRRAPGYNCVYVKEGQNKLVSTVHDVPLETGRDRVYNMVVEIPRWTSAETEISRTTPLNPICPNAGGDGGEPRLVDNAFPSHGLPWNAGKFPQTWLAEDRRAGVPGGGRMVDVLEIGGRVLERGLPVAVKVLGACGRKVIAIAADDPNADAVHDVEDVRARFPGLLEYAEWRLRTRETAAAAAAADGGRRNESFAGRNAAIAAAAVEDAHGRWEDVQAEPKGASPERMALANTTLANGWTITQSRAECFLSGSSKKPVAAPPPLKNERWRYPRTDENGVETAAAEIV